MEDSTRKGDETDDEDWTDCLEDEQDEETHDGLEDTEDTEDTEDEIGLFKLVDFRCTDWSSSSGLGGGVTGRHWDGCELYSLQFNRFLIKNTFGILIMTTEKEKERERERTKEMKTQQ